VNGVCTTGNPLVTPMTHLWIVDNICGHRFAGIDSGGVNCFAHQMPGGSGDTTPLPSTTTTTAPPVPSGGPTTTTAGTSAGGTLATAPPATPVSAAPAYTG
jgi:hypothetical protein